MTRKDDHVNARAKASAAVAAGAALVAATMVTLAPAAHAATTTCAQFGTVSVNSNQYIVQNDEWNSTSQQCITVNGTSFSVQASQNLPTNGPPASYPSIYRGCHWGNCTTGSGMPVQVSHIGSATSSWSTTQPSSGAYDVAYDIWYNTTPTTSGQPDGTELMIWMNSRGGPQPAGSIVGTVALAGATWNVWQNRMNGWNYIAYQRQQGTTSLTNLNLKAFTQDAVSRGQINPAWYLIAIEAGFEIWQGGTGLATNSFSAGVTTG
jgi:glycosyl hydrolase family 12